MKKLVRENLIISNKKSNLNEGFATTESRNLDTIVNVLDYDGFAEFLGDNPGCYSAIVEWIEQEIEFLDRLTYHGFSPEEAERLGLYNTAERIRDEVEDYTEEE